MRRDRRRSKNHPDWDFQYVPLETAWELGIDTVTKPAVVSARHNPDPEDLWVITEEIELPLWSGDTLLILPGFCTDWASIPKPVRPLLPHDALCVRRAAVTHDALYNIGGERYDWHDSNEVFRRIILEDGGSRTYAKLAHWGVETKIGEWHFNTEKVFDIQNREFCRLIEAY